MKTTLEIPKTVIHRAMTVAAQRGISLSALTESLEILNLRIESDPRSEFLKGNRRSFDSLRAPVRTSVAQDDKSEG